MTCQCYPFTAGRTVLAYSHLLSDEYGIWSRDLPVQTQPSWVANQVSLGQFPDHWPTSSSEGPQVSHTCTTLYQNWMPWLGLCRSHNSTCRFGSATCIYRWAHRWLLNATTNQSSTSTANHAPIITPRVTMSTPCLYTEVNNYNVECSWGSLSQQKWSWCHLLKVQGRRRHSQANLV